MKQKQRKKIIKVSLRANPDKIRMSAAIFLFPLLIMLINSVSVFAAPTGKTWVNNSGGIWSNASNWDPAEVPDENNDIIIPSTVSSCTITMDITAGTTIRSLTMSGGNAHTLTLSGNLRIGEGLTVSSVEIINLGSCTAAVGRDVFISGSISSTTGELTLGISTDQNFSAPNCTANVKIVGNSIYLTGDSSFKNLTIDNGAKLYQQDYNFTVKGNMHSDGSYNAGLGTITFNNGTLQSVFMKEQGIGKVAVLTSNTIVSLYDNTDFTALTIGNGAAFKCTGAGKTITIDNTSYISVASGGTFTLAGTSGNTLILLSNSSGNAFDFNAASGATVSLSYAKIKDCNASAGIEINGQNNCVNLGGNTNVDFEVPGKCDYLAATSGAGTGEVILSWKAAGDDGGSGTASSYIVKYADFAVGDDGKFNDATTYVQTWSPLGGSIEEAKTLVGLPAGINLYFAIKAVDGVGGTGAISDSPSTLVPDNSRTWYNDSGGYWGDDGNWSPNGVPTSDNEAYILDLGRDYEILIEVTEDRDVKSLTMNHGSGGEIHQLRLNGGNLRIFNDLTMSNNEHIDLSSYILKVRKNISSGSALVESTSGDGEIWLDGAGSQNLSMSNCSANMRISNTSATVSLAGNTSSKNFVIANDTILNQGIYNFTVKGDMQVDGTYIKGTGNLIFENGISNEQSLLVGNDQNLGKVVVGAADTSVNLQNSAKFDSIIVTNNTNAMFRDITGGTTVTINNTSFVSVGNAGTFMVKGSSGNNAVLQSDSPGNAFDIIVAGGGTVSFLWVSIKDCNASGGIKINAQDNCTNLGGNTNIDFYAPSAITNLSASTGVNSGEINLTWTAVGDDTTTGTASSYVVKYSTSVITTDALFTSATTYTQSWSPLGAGGTETKTLSGLTAGATYYVAIEAVDGVGSKGGLSNTTGNFAMAYLSTAKTWTWWGDGNWSDASKWNPTGVPNASSNVVIPYDNPDPMTITMDIAGGVTIASLYMDGGDEFPYTLNLQGNMNITGNVTLSVSQTISLNSYNAVMKGNVAISGTANSSTGELQLAGTGPQNLYVWLGTPDIRISNTANTVSLSIMDSVCKNLTIDSGAVLNQDTINLTLRGNMTANGIYTKGTGVLTFNGGTLQSVSVLNNQNLGKVNVSASGTTLNLINSANFTNITISGAVFKNYVTGITMTVDNTSFLTVKNAGKFILTGTGGNNIVLQSDSSGNQFDFVKASGCTVTLSYVSIKDCNASGGLEINAQDNCTDLGGNTKIDFYVPSEITNLSASSGLGSGEINITWTAVGDDTTTGTASSYVVKYSTSVITTDALFTSATTYTQSWSPLGAGNTETKTLSGLTAGTVYYVSIKAIDNMGGTGALSNTTGNSAMAQISGKTWNAGTGSWNVAGNWDPTGVPSALSDVVIPTSVVASTITMDITSGTTISSLTMSGGNAHALNLSGGLNITGNLTMSSLETISIGSCTATVKGNVSASGNITSSTGELKLAGTLSQSLSAPNCSTANIRISNTSATVSLGSDTSSKDFTISPSAVLNQGAYNLAISGTTVLNGTYLKGTGNLEFNKGGSQDISIPVANNTHLGKVKISKSGTIASLWDTNARFTSITIANGTKFDIEETAQDLNTISIDSGSFITVESGGTFYLDGYEAHGVTWSSSSSGNSFSFNAASGSTVSLTEVFIKDCNASGGVEVNAQNLCTNLGGNTNVDFYAPSAITNLTASTGVNAGEVNLTWTATGDDTTTGTASSYLVKYSTSKITTAVQFNSATTYTQSWNPLGAGSTENKTLSGLVGGTTYYVSIKAVDGVGGAGGLSNTTGNSAVAYADVVGVAKTWLCIGAGNWSTAGNWTPAGVPATGDDVYINTNDQEDSFVTMDIAGGTTVKSLTMEKQAGYYAHSLNLLYNLNITEGLTVSGSEVISLNAYTVIVKGNVASSGNITSTTGELSLSGTSAQSLSVSNSTANIRISNTSATVSLTGNTSSKNFTIDSGAVLSQGTSNLTVSGNLAVSGTYTKGTGILIFNNGTVQSVTVLNNQNLGKINISTANTTVSLLSSAKFTSIANAVSTTFKSTAAGTTITIDNSSFVSINGPFSLIGSSGNNIVFMSSSSGNSFNLASSISNIGSYISFKDCNATIAEINGQNNCTDLGGNTKIDFYVPSSITNLTASTGVNGGEINLTWTAVGDDTTSGTVSGYIVKYSTSEIKDNDQFNAASTYEHSWDILSGAGQTENRTLSGLVAGTTYYISIKAEDNVGGSGGISNITGNSAMAQLADIITWTGAGDGMRWNDSSNWSPNGDPSNKNVIFPNYTASTVDVDSDYTIQSLRIEDALTMSIGGTLYVSGGLTVVSGASNPVVTGRIEVQGNAGIIGNTNIDQLVLNGSSVQSLNLSGFTSDPYCQLSIYSVGGVTLSSSGSCGSFDLNGGAIFTQGPYNLTVFGIIGLDAGGTFNKGTGGAKLILSQGSEQFIYAAGKDLGNVEIAAGTIGNFSANAVLSSLIVNNGAQFKNTTAGTTTTVDNTSFVTVISGGIFNITGTSAGNIVLRSNSSGNAFDFNAASGSTVTLSYAKIKDCNANGGVQLSALEGCVDLGGNTNIEFPPAPITNLAASTGNSEGEINLTWASVGDDWNTGSASSYLVKYSTSKITTEAQFTSASTYTQSWSPLGSGQSETQTLSGLTAGTTYYISIKAQDDLNKKGTLSNITGNFAMAKQASDTVLPSAITNLSAVTGNSTGEINLTWTAVGDDTTTGTVSSYVVKYSADRITTQALFDSASTYTQSWSPLGSGQTETKTLAGLTAGTTYYISIEAKDEIPNQGTLGNEASAAAKVSSDAIAPSPITNLSASTGVSSGEINLTWSAVGDDGSSGTAASYVVKYSTSAIDSQSLFNNANTYAQSWIPLASGQLETKTLSGLAAGTTYFIAIEAVDEIPNQGSLSNSASAAAKYVPPADTLAPQSPVGVKGEYNSQGQFIISWSAAARNADGTNIIDLASYKIYRGTSLAGEKIFMAVVLKDISPLQWIEIDPNVKAGGAVYYYTVRAVDASGNESVDSMIINTSNETVITSGNDDVNIIITGNDKKDLFNAGNNAYKEDVRIVFSKREETELAQKVNIYEIKALKDSTGEQISNLQFARLVELKFKLSDFSKSSKKASSSSASENYGVFWWDGVKWVRLGGSVDASGGTISIKTVKMGMYKIKETQRAKEFTILQLSPTKIFTPNGDGKNDTIEIFFDNPNDSVVSLAKVYDITGAEVADLKAGSTINSYLWDGKNKNGDYVSGGVYIYQIVVEGKVLNGTVVVAR